MWKLRKADKATIGVMFFEIFINIMYKGMRKRQNK